MKTLVYFSLAAVVAALTLSCSEKIDEPQDGMTQETAKVELTFSAESASLTKTSLSGDEVLWTEGDAISLFGGDGSNSEFVSSNISGSTASFSGLAVPAENYYAIYPYNASATYSKGGGVITTELPAAQPAVQSSFGNGINLSVAAASGQSLSFKNVCGLASLTIESIPEGRTLTSISLQGRNSEPLAGAVDIKVSDLSATVSASGSPVITLSAESITAGTYVFTVLPVDLPDGIIITFGYSDGGSSKMTTSTGVSFLSGVNNVLPDVAAIAPEDGSAENPYKIASVADMNRMSEIIAGLELSTMPSVHFSLVADVDMSGVDWTPLYAPTGFPWDSYPVIYFDGRNHSISNLSVNAKRHASFFGVLIGECYNLTFVNPVIAAGEGTPAGVVTSALSSYNRETKSKLTNVKVTGGSVTGLNAYTMTDTWDAPGYGAGGLCGVVRNGSQIYDSSYSGSVSGTIAGGIAGAAQSGGEITRCTFAGTATAHGSAEITTAYAGGIVGYMSGEGSSNRFWIKECSTSGSIDASDSAYSAGGIAGFVANDTWVEYSYSTASILGGTNAGGIVGSAWGAWGLTVMNCVAWCGSYHSSPAACDEQEGIGYIIGGIKGGYQSLHDCYSNINSVSLIWDVPDGESNQVKPATEDEAYSIEDTETIKMGYNGKSADTLTEALTAAGINVAAE